MSSINLRYLKIFNSDGRRYAYYRRAGRTVRIQAAVGAQSFPAAYQAAREEWERQSAVAVALPPSPPSKGAAAGTLAALVQAYKSAPDFRKNAVKTQKDYARVLDMVTTRFGIVGVQELTRAWVLRMRDEVQATPRTANMRVSVISAMLSFAVDREMRRDNPALRLKKLPTGPGYRCWTPSEVAAMTSPAAGDVTLPVLFGRWTAQREGDVLKLLWSAYDGSTIKLTQSKTGTSLVLPVPADLKAALDKAPRTGVLICLTSAGKAWNPDHFRHRFAQVRDCLGLAATVHFHGLRHTRLTELAEAGASDKELQASSGHKTTQSLSRYTASARQQKLAQAAFSR